MIYKNITEMICGIFKRVAQSEDMVVAVVGGALNPAIIQLQRAELKNDVVPVEHPQICAVPGMVIVLSDGVR